MGGAAATDAARVAAVASRDLGRARAYATAHGIPRAHGSDEALLADPDVDAVYIPLPNSLHVEWSIRALRVHGEQVIGGDGVDIAFSGTMRFPGDVLAQFDCGLAAALRMELEAVGDAGSLRMTDPWKGVAPAIELRSADGGLERVACERADPYARELEDFARAVAGEPTKFGRADAVGQARAIAALYESADAGTGVTA